MCSVSAWLVGHPHEMPMERGVGLVSLPALSVVT